MVRDPTLSSRASTTSLTAAQLDLETRIGHQFTDPVLLQRALTHKSAVDPHEQVAHSYERLEFLGDRVLGLVISDLLHHSHRSESEGELARRLNALVRKETCADVGREIDLGSALILGESERQSEGHKKQAILGDACEALIAALYLDAGLEVARTFVLKHWEGRNAARSETRRDAKTMLQEWAQGNGSPLPRYDVTDRSGPDHAPVFQIAVRVGSLPPLSGSGTSKRHAEQAAAEAFLIDQGVWPDAT